MAATDMGFILAVIGGGCVAAAIFAKDKLAGKEVHVLVVGLLMIGVALAILGDGQECATGWDGRGSYADC